MAENHQNADLLGVFLGGGRYQEVANGPVKFVLSQITTYADGASAVKSLPSPMFPHGFAVDPQDTNRFLAFEKIGDGAAEYDLANWRIVRTLTPQPHRLFYGHGVFSTDAKLLYTTETDTADSKGYIGIRDAQTLEYLGDFPTYGDHPHDCQLIDGGNTLVVTNGGGDKASRHLGNLSYISIAKRTLIKQYPVSDERFNAGHVELDAKGDALVVSAPRRGLSTDNLGAIHVHKAGKKLQRLSQPSAVATRLTGEALSALMVPEQDLIVVTHPTPGLVTCWSIDTLKLRKAIELPFARGLALTCNNDEFLVSFGSNGSARRYTTGALEAVEHSTVENTLISGSHLMNWQKFHQATL